jgi:hypothetical protein
MALRARYLKTKLSRPLPIKGGRVLHTVGQARAYMLALPEARALRAHWQHARAILLAETNVFDLTRQLHLALFMDGLLDLAAMEPTNDPSKRRTLARDR